jgi:ribose transport system permease protein
MPAFIVTLATWQILDGLALQVLPTDGGTVAPGLENVLGTQTATIVITLVLILIWLVLRNTRFGVTVYALGSRETAARQAGLRVRRAKVSVYVFSGLTAVAAGVFYSAVVTVSGSPTAGDPFVLEAFAAVVVGGTILSGGRGGFVGTMFGALLLSVIGQVIVFAGVQSYYSVLAYGAVLVIMVSIYSLPALLVKLRAGTR